jgi:hypothetical protein
MASKTSRWGRNPEFLKGPAIDFFRLRRRIGCSSGVGNVSRASCRLRRRYHDRITESEQCDVIQVQHCSQYVPIIRAFNPKAKIVLHIHAECFSQSNLGVIERRLHLLDLLLTVRDYVARITQHDVRALADRCETTYNGIDA